MYDQQSCQSEQSDRQVTNTKPARAKYPYYPPDATTGLLSRRCVRHLQSHLQTYPRFPSLLLLRSITNKLRVG